MNEIWVVIPGYCYEVSNQGNVKNQKTGKLLKAQTNTHNYKHVALYKDGVRKTCLVSLLVWEAFKGPIPQGMQINHNDEDKSNNALSNLSLMTPKENSNWGTRNKRVSISQKNNPSKSRRVLQYDLSGQLVCEYPSAREAARQTNHNVEHIAACCRGKQSTAYGFKWEYKEKNEQ